MKKLLFLTLLLSSVFMMSFADETKKAEKRADRIEKYKNMTDAEKAELKKKRIEKITEKLKAKGKTDAEIATILDKREKCIEKGKAKLEEYKDKLKADGKTDAEIEKLVQEKREKIHKKMKAHHKNKKNKE
jgi:hypothetical protein